MAYHNELLVRISGISQKDCLSLIDNLQIDLARHETWAVEWHEDFDQSENDEWLVGFIEIYFASDSDGALAEMIETAVHYDCCVEYRVDTY